MQTPLFPDLRRRVIWLGILTLVLVSCADQTPTVQTSDEALQLAGSWVLKARISNGKETPAKQRILQLVLKPDGTFTAYFRGDEHQDWIKAGQGGFSYAPPLLTFFWENGTAVRLLVTELQPDRIKIHHGRNLVPLKDQEPEEIFVRKKLDKGPTRKAS